MKATAKKTLILVGLMLFWSIALYFAMGLVAVVLHVLGYRGPQIEFIFGNRDRWILVIALAAFFIARRQTKKQSQSKIPPSA